MNAWRAVRIAFGPVLYVFAFDLFLAVATLPAFFVGAAAVIIGTALVIV